MRIFIDTNIFLDVILQRKYYKEGLLILNSCNNDFVQEFLANKQ